mgnify:FL=1
MVERRREVELIEKEELKKLVGGGVSTGVSVALALTAGIVFVIGVIDGYLRPLLCHTNE